MVCLSCDPLGGGGHKRSGCPWLPGSDVEGPVHLEDPLYVQPLLSR